MAPPADPFVRVVVLNWNSAWFTRRCLRSLERTEYPAERYEVVLVDNGSVDGSLEQLRHSFPDLRVIANGDNLGFAEGCNRGMRDRRGVDHVALVNNDAVVEPGWLRALVDALEADPGAGAASARLVLEPTFAPLDVAADGLVTLDGAVLDGLDVTATVRTDGFRSVSALDWPLDVTRELPGPGRGRLWVPAAAGARHLELRLGGPGRAEVSGPGSVVRRDGGTFDVQLGAERRPLLNGVGTAINELGEGYDLHYGEEDDGRVEPAVVPGFCGGGALLRSAMLDRVGLFDPELFAYYEDTDLAWRARRDGWRVLGVPGAEIHHAFGGSAGSTAPGFFYLDRRNWWLTSERNGTAAERSLVRRRVRGAIVLAVRANVLGRLRRGRAPRWALVATWGRIVADSALISLRRRLPSRSRSTVGAAATDRVRGRFQPRPGPRAPRPRPGGPAVAYLDVTGVLRPGSAGTDGGRTRRIVADLPDAVADVELVPVVRTDGPAGFRRVTSGEYARLLAAAATPAAASPAAATPAGPDRAAPTPEEDVAPDLHLDRLEPGTAFVDPGDGPVRPPGHGVGLVAHVGDVSALEHPERFDPAAVAAAQRSTGVRLDRADVVLVDSEAAAEGVRRVAARRGRADLQVRVVPDGPGPDGPRALAAAIRSVTTESGGVASDRVSGGGQAV